MAVREAIQIGHPALKAPNQQVAVFDSPKVRELVGDLRDTMRDAELIGLASPQIGRNYRVFVTGPRETKFRSKDQADELRVFINPRIVELSDEETIIYEGCGSVLHGQLFGPVRRPRVITIEAYDESGRRFRFRADGILGRVIQHEFDHLQGIEFLEKVDDYSKLMAVEHYLEQIKDDPRFAEALQITVKEVLE